jgi:hypothetical protein
VILALGGKRSTCGLYLQLETILALVNFQPHNFFQDGTMWGGAGRLDFCALLILEVQILLAQGYLLAVE